MTDPVLNHTLFPGNHCYGCGHHNASGLGLRVDRANDGSARVIGRLPTRDDLCGFPGIVHGGAVYTALDCLASWTAFLLRPERGALWLLRSAQVTYERPVPAGCEVHLVGAIDRAGDPWRDVVVALAAESATGDCYVRGTFKVVPLTIEKFLQVTGSDRLPPEWQEFVDALASAPTPS